MTWLAQGARWRLALLAVALAPGVAHAVGLDGPAQAERRLGASVGAGWDHVGGVLGRDGFAFFEVSGHADARIAGPFAIGGSLSFRRDAADYNFALARWRGGASGIAAQLTAGYDGPVFHLSAGPWLYGDNRDGRRFRAALLPLVLRLRIGDLDRWHFNLRLADGAPFTAEGAALGLRVLVGAPPRGRHRLKGGLYTSPGEQTFGLAVFDEIAAAAWGDAALRLGLLLGTDYGQLGRRPELTFSAGLVW
jgi:hypothetical protein